VNEALTATRTALGELPAWLVGGALRDRLIGRETPDLDVVLRGDVSVAARTLARASGGHAFALSDAFGAWRVVAARGGWAGRPLAAARRLDRTRPGAARTSRSTRSPSRSPAVR